jgi:hypothetical protein
MRLSVVCTLAATGLILLASTGIADNAPVPCTPDLTGHWSGQWTSCATGHCGPLHASFCRTDDCHYHVVFHGRFAKIIPFRYTMTLNVTGSADGKVFLAGEKRLPGFGVFSFTAEATQCEFIASYCSRSDNGKFELHRD